MQARPSVNMFSRAETGIFFPVSELRGMTFVFFFVMKDTISFSCMWHVRTHSLMIWGNSLQFYFLRFPPSPCKKKKKKEREEKIKCMGEWLVLSNVFSASIAMIRVYDSILDAEQAPIILEKFIWPWSYTFYKYAHTCIRSEILLAGILLRTFVFVCIFPLLVLSLVWCKSNVIFIK